MGAGSRRAPKQRGTQGDRPSRALEIGLPAQQRLGAGAQRGDRASLAAWLLLLSGLLMRHVTPRLVLTALPVARHGAS